MNTIHKMKLKPEPFNKILSRSKDIELRLFDKKRQQLKIGDTIHFRNSLNDELLICSILDLIKKEQFSDICNDQIFKNRAGFNENDNIDDIMSKYYSKEQVIENGVLGIILGFSV